MNRLMLLLSFVLLAVTISCDNNSVSSDESNNYGSITGTVLTEFFSKVELAEVFTIPPTETMLTDSEGKFTFSKVPEGNYKVYAKKEGYPLKFVDIGVLRKKVSNATIVLSPTPTINSDVPKPTLLAPVNNSLTSTSTVLKWSFTPLDDAKYSYIVYLDTKESPTQIYSADFTFQQFQLQYLDIETKYYWKIGVTNEFGDYNESEVWSFTVSEHINMGGMILDLKVENRKISDNSPYKFGIRENLISFGSDRFGIENKAIRFTGPSYLEVLNIPEYIFTTDFSILVWVNPSTGYGNPFNNEVDLLSRYEGAAANKSSFAFYLNNGNVSAEISSKGRHILKTNYTLPFDTWTHLALVYQSNSLLIYANGNFVDSKTVPTPDISIFHLNIGRRVTDNRYFIGLMDDIMIFSRALTIEEIQELAK